jgi:hypothetical protein
MHWTRLVDLPIAATILVCRLFTSPLAAERIAEVAVPLATLGCVMALIALITRRLVGAGPALFAAALIPTAPLLWAQLQPLRIDHHGWQIVMSLVMALGVLDRQGRRGGIVAGLAAATGLTISVEGLPFAAVVGALFAWRWARDDRPGVASFAISLAAAGLAYLAAMQPPSEWLASRCDSLASPYLAGLIVVAAGTALAVGLGPAARFRLGALAVVGMAGAGAVILVEPRCSGGPLAQLDPIAQQWLRLFPEGRPIWDQDPAVVAMILGFPIFGLIGSWLARRQAEDEARRDWTSLFWLQLAAVAIAAMAQRAGAIESALALPGSVALTAELLARIGRLRLLLPRVLASGGAIVLLFPLTPPLTVNMLASASTHEPPKAERGCTRPEVLQGLDALPPSNIAATFDLSPILLSRTRHRVLATGHHRNEQGMKDLIYAFTGPLPAAHAVLKQRDVRYLVLCRDSHEIEVLGREGPGGLIDRLMHDAPPAWLRPHPLGSAPGLDVWEVS